MENVFHKAKFVMSVINFGIQIMVEKIWLTDLGF